MKKQGVVLISDKKFQFKGLQAVIEREFDKRTRELVCPGDENDWATQYRVAAFLEIVMGVIEPMAHDRDRNVLEAAILMVHHKYRVTYGRTDYVHRASPKKMREVEQGILCMTGNKPLTVELLIQMMLGSRAAPKRTKVGDRPWIRTTPRERNV